MGHQLPAQLFRAGTQQRLDPLCPRDIGVDRDPAALGQRRAFDRDRPSVRSGSLHIVRFEGAGLIDPAFDKAFHILDRAIFAADREMTDGVFERRTGAGQVIGQVEHPPERFIAQGKPQVDVIDAERLADQVEPGGHQGLLLAVGHIQWRGLLDFHG